MFHAKPKDKVLSETASLTLQPNAKPVHLPPRRVPLALREKVEKVIQGHVLQGHWTPVESSPWATPLVPVVKPNGDVRLCGDYKVTVNKNLIIADHPLPHSEEIFTKISSSLNINNPDSAVFSTLDLKSAYYQLEMDEESKDICVVNTHIGLFRVHRLAFGIASAPAIWQKLIERIFSNCPGVVIFLDDILIFGKDVATHNACLKQVFDVLSKKNIKLEHSKCFFNKKEVQYLGFRIDGRGIHKTDDKIKAIANCRRPENVTEMKSFLGLVTFYARFVPRLASLACPLYALTKKSSTFLWGKEAERAFQDIKSELQSKRFLTHYNKDLPLKLATDASAVGLGAVLSHTFPDGSDRPIAYISRKMTETETRYSQVEKEALAIVYSVKRLHFYLYGRNHFLLLTDHRPLLALFGSKRTLPPLAAARLQRWAVLLSAYNYDIQYRPGTAHGNADAMTRAPVLPTSIDEDETEKHTSVFMLNLWSKHHHHDNGSHAGYESR